MFFLTCPFKNVKSHVFGRLKNVDLKNVFSNNGCKCVLMVIIFV